MQSKTHPEDAPLTKPEGGYVSIASVTIGLLWWSLSEGLITSWAVRVGLALFEVRIRRSAYIWSEKRKGRGAPEFVPSYSAAELASLCGLPPKRVRAALKELLELGLLAEFSPEVIRFARSVSEVRLSPEQCSAFRSWLESLTKRRRVPIPRRVLVLACESSSRALIAVVLGVCLRCSWLRPGEGFSFSGRVSCGWLARRFRLSSRAVESAKAHLVGLGWLERTGNINRLGEVVAINPAWHRLISLTEAENSPVAGAGESPAETSPRTNSAGVIPAPGPNSAGVSLTQESPSGEEIQIPRESPRAHAPESPGLGFFIQDPKRGPKNQDHSGPKLPPPRLSAIRPEDLRSMDRLLGEGGLFRQAVKAGLLNEGEDNELYFVACAERARTAEVKNPCGLFNVLMKNRKKFGTYISAEQENSARLRIRGWRYPRIPGGVPVLVEREPDPGRGNLPVAGPTFGGIAKPVPPAMPGRPRFSEDANFLRRLQNNVCRNLERVYPVLREKYGWDRPRFVAARAELEEASGMGCSPRLSYASNSL